MVKSTLNIIRKVYQEKKKKDSIFIRHESWKKNLIGAKENFELLASFTLLDFKCPHSEA